MPKETFHNLKSDKRELIMDAFLREFALKTYDEASISEVVKQLGIAKGSIYQYFNDKMDLFVYLIGECSAVKQKYTASVDRNSFNDFWAYFREIYVLGFQFDAENPLESHFLHNLTQNLNSPSVKQLYDDLLMQVISAFESMVAAEVERNLFRNDISIKSMGFMLYKFGASIQEQLEYSGIINPKESIRKSIPVYQNRKNELMQTVDEYMEFMKPAFNKNKP